MPLDGRVRELRFGRPIERVVEDRLEQSAGFGLGSGELNLQLIA
jgi:hypothetical protein